jgi:hypothetical protein
VVKGRESWLVTREHALMELEREFSEILASGGDPEGTAASGSGNTYICGSPGLLTHRLSTFSASLKWATVWVRRQRGDCAGESGFVILCPCISSAEYAVEAEWNYAVSVGGFEAFEKCHCSRANRWTLSAIKRTLSEVCDHWESFCVSSFSLKQNEESESIAPLGVVFAFVSARTQSALLEHNSGVST